MTCVICKSGTPAPGSTTATFQREVATVVISGVPAEICPQCGERYYDEATAEQLLALVRDAVRAGVKVEIREYVAA